VCGELIYSCYRGCKVASCFVISMPFIQKNIRKNDDLPVTIAATDICIGAENYGRVSSWSKINLFVKICE
jgi:hypothetical protein